MRIKRTTFPGWALREFKHCSEGQARAGTPCQFWWVSCCCCSSTLASGYARCQSHAWTLFCNLKQIHFVIGHKYILQLGTNTLTIKDKYILGELLLWLSLGLRLCAQSESRLNPVYAAFAALVNQSNSRQSALYLGFNHLQTKSRIVRCQAWIALNLQFPSNARQILDEVGWFPTRMMSRQFSNQSTSFGMEEQKSKHKRQL